MRPTLSPEEIAEQQQLLATYRRTLAIYVQQQAQLGRAYSPAGLLNGIAEARGNIRRIKALLRQAGVEVAEDPDDEEPPPPSLPHIVVLPTQSGRLTTWIQVVGAVGVVIVAAILLVQFLSPLVGNRPLVPATAELSVATDEPSAATPESTAEPVAETAEPSAGTLELEQRLRDANIQLSASGPNQVDDVRSWIAESGHAYQLLAIHALEVVGEHSFREPIYLDELDEQYTKLVGENHYADFEPDKLKEAMLLAWNGHYPQEQLTSYEQML